MENRGNECEKTIQLMVQHTRSVQAAHDGGLQYQDGSRKKNLENQNGRNPLVGSSTNKAHCNCNMETGLQQMARQSSKYKPPDLDFKKGRVDTREAHLEEQIISCLKEAYSKYKTIQKRAQEERDRFLMRQIDQVVKSNDTTRTTQIKVGKSRSNLLTWVKEQDKYKGKD